MLHIFNISSVQELYIYNHIYIYHIYISYIYIYIIYIYNINISQFSKLFPFPEELVCESSKTNQKMFNTFLKFKNCKTVSLFLTTMTATIAKTLTTCLKCSRQCQKNPAALNLDNCVGLRSSQILTTMSVPTSLGTIVKLRAAGNIPGNYFHIFQKPALHSGSIDMNVIKFNSLQGYVLDIVMFDLVFRHATPSAKQPLSSPKSHPPSTFTITIAMTTYPPSS